MTDAAKRRGRPPKIMMPAPERPVQPLTEAEMAQIAPLSKRGQPDLYNFMPTRMVPLSEAEARGWSMYYEGQQCRYGHYAPRYTSNANLCIDCHRIKRGKQPMGSSGPVIVDRFMVAKAGNPKKKGDDDDDGRNAVGATTATRKIEPDIREKHFLTAYAETRNFADACDAVRMSQGQVHMRLSTSEVFKRACVDLETRLQLKRPVPDAAEFDWDEDKRVKFLTVFVDTGDIAMARDAIGLTPSQMHKELEVNQDFATRYEQAAALAHNVLEERAIQLALSGNDKLLVRVLAARKPDLYRESVKVDMNVQEKLSDEQIDARLRRLWQAANARRPVIDVEYADATPEIGVVGSPGREGTQGQSEQNLDLL